MTLNAYIDGLKGKRIAVLGIGVSNRPLLRLLLDAGCDVTPVTPAAGKNWDRRSPGNWNSRAAG